MLVAAIAAYQGLWSVSERVDRLIAYREAEAYARSVGKPLLIVGVASPAFSHPNGDPTYGDVAVDLDPAKEEYSTTTFQVADVRALPFGDGEFGAAFCSHVLEHLETPADVQAAVDELTRVADRVWILVPSPLSPVAWLHPQHRSVVMPVEGGLLVNPFDLAEASMFVQC